ncbi:ras guanine nucleotide exchange factor domain-containing protein [Chytridium lagenaria]|nr:ras guanine nucleotide exchange factor domain-containing protein [Chytridium lagenaria]
MFCSDLVQLLVSASVSGIHAMRESTEVERKLILMQDVEFMKMFFIVYKKFMRGSELLDWLLDMFDAADETSPQTSAIHPAQLRRPRDFFIIFGVPAPRKHSSSVATSISHFNHISSWYSYLYKFIETKLKARAKVLCKFMKMAQALESLMSSERSFSAYRQALKRAEHHAFILGVFLPNKDYKQDGAINVPKFLLMSDIILMMQSFQMIGMCRILRFPYNQYAKNHAVVVQLLSEPLLSDSLTKFSILEPRLTRK